MNKHERKRVTDRTIQTLDRLILTAGNRMAGHNGDEGDVPIRVPAQTARDIRAIAHDTAGRTGRKARLDTAEAVVAT